MLQKKALFAVIEGIDGSGKTTLLNNLNAKLSVFATVNRLAEPTDLTDAGREIRRLLRGTGNIPDDILSERLQDLFRIDREWDVRHRIRPALKRNEIVLLDRYYISTAAYQGSSFESAEQIVQDYLVDPSIEQPNLVLYLDVFPELALRRIRERDANRDIFEAIEKLEKVYRNYEYLWNSVEFPFPVYRLRAEEGQEAILENALEIIGRHAAEQVDV